MAEPIYALPVYDTLKTAWDKIPGVKSTFWAAYGVVFLISLVVTLVEKILTFILPLALLEPLARIIMFLFIAGFAYMGILRATNSPITYTSVFRVFQKDLIIRLVFFIILRMAILISSLALAALSGYLIGLTRENGGFLLLFGIICVVASLFVYIYLYISTTLGLGFVLARNSRPWQALVQSFHASQSNVFEIAAIIVVQLLGTVLGLIPVFLILYVVLVTVVGGVTTGTLGSSGIPPLIILTSLPLLLVLIWWMPFIFITYGTLFTRLAPRAPD